MRATGSTIMVLALVAEISTAQAGEPITGELVLERHHTSNALDGPFALADWYSVLRGSLQQAVRLGSTKITIAAAGQVASFDQTIIEDDRALGVALSAERSFGKRLELRGTLSWKRASEGDDLLIEDTILGIRTTTDTFGAAIQAAATLGGGYVLAGELGVERETAGATRFEAELIEPVLLSPRKDRVQLGAKLARQWETGSLAGAWATELVFAGRQSGAPYTFDLMRNRIAIEGKSREGAPAAVEVSFGLDHLRISNGTLDVLRPTYAANLSYLLGKSGIALRLAATGVFDTRNTDDPVASRYSRQEVGLTWQAGAKLELGLGLYNSWREYLTLGGGEHDRGAFATARYALADKLSLVLRADLSRRDTSGIGRVNAADILIGLRAGI